MNDIPMDKTTEKYRKPKLIVSEIDYERIVGLATAALNRSPDVSEELLAEMERAKIVSDRAMPDSVVRMGSVVEFRSDDGRQRRVTLVYPVEADIAEGKVSIMTPIGAALIGLSQGQSIRWTARDGRQHQLTVLAVEQPAAAPA